MSRIKTIGGGVGGGGAPTVVIGPEFGTDILHQEHGFGTSFSVEANFQFSQEHLVRLFEIRSGPHEIRQEQEFTGGTYIGPPQFQGIETSVSTANTTSITLSLPSTVAGLYQLAIVGNNADSTVSAPAGWTPIVQVRNAGLSGPVCAAFGKFTSAGESTAYAFTWANNGGAIGSIESFAAVDSANPVAVSAGSTGNATDPVCPSVTATTINNFLIAACAQTNAVSQTYTPPADHTERADLTGTAAANVVTGEVATRIQASSGASGTATLNSNQALASAYAAIHIVLNAKQGGSSFS